MKKNTLRPALLALTLLLSALLCAACSSQDAPASAAQTAYDEIIAEYQDLYASVQSLGSLDYYEWLENYSDSYRQDYPNVSGGYLDFCSAQDHFYTGYADLDNSEGDELILAIASQPGQVPRPIALYYYDGTAAQQVDLFYADLLADGIIVERGNGGFSHEIHRLDQGVLTEITVPDLPLNTPTEQMDYASHGGHLANSLTWSPLPEKEAS